MSHQKEFGKSATAPRQQPFVPASDLHVLGTSSKLQAAFHTTFIVVIKTQGAIVLRRTYGSSQIYNIQERGIETEKFLENGRRAKLSKKRA